MNMSGNFRGEVIAFLFITRDRGWKTSHYTKIVNSERGNFFFFFEVFFVSLSGMLRFVSKLEMTEQKMIKLS